MYYTTTLFLIMLYMDITRTATDIVLENRLSCFVGEGDRRRCQLSLRNITSRQKLLQYISQDTP